MRSTTKSTDSIVNEWRSVITVTSDTDKWTPLRAVAGVRVPMSVAERSTMVPSFKASHRSMAQPPALRVANFSPDTNEWHRQNFIVRRSLQSSNASGFDAESVWWWYSSSETGVGLAEPVRDRITAQINYVPATYSRRKASDAISIKTIYVPRGDTKRRRDMDKFTGGQCLVDACSISTDPVDAKASDMRLMFGDTSLFEPAERVKPPGQIWMMYLLESPAYTGKFHHVDDLINWTATFRWDSTIVTPYAKFVPTFPQRTLPSQTSRLIETSKIPTKNYAVGKTKMVAWFVSNCFPRNERSAYVEELSRHLPVDVFGTCGKPSCRRHDLKCWLRLRREYKFYLSFENSNCDYYITEKFFGNALK